MLHKMPYQNLILQNMEMIEEQYRKTVFLDINEIFDSKVRTEAEVF